MILVLVSIFDIFTITSTITTIILLRIVILVHGSLEVGDKAGQDLQELFSSGEAPGTHSLDLTGALRGALKGLYGLGFRV